MESLKHKAVVLFTGGLDSLACYYYAKEKLTTDITGLYVDLSTPYTDVELAAADVLCRDIGIELKVVPMQFMGELGDKVGHVQFRNLFLLEIAALYGDNIFFGMLHGELSEDKGWPFVRRMQDLFDSQTIENLYHAKSKIRIWAPFGNKTKTEVVKYLLDRGVTKTQLRQTVGCMKGTVCGQCPSCFNRWVSFETNS